METLKIHIANFPRVILVAICLGLSLLVGIVDYATGDYGITVAYILPIYISAKLLGRRACLCFTAVCIFELIGLTLIARQASETFFDAIFWNAVLQSAELGITGCLIAQFTDEICTPIKKQPD